MSVNGSDVSHLYEVHQTSQLLPNDSDQRDLIFDPTPDMINEVIAKMEKAAGYRRGGRLIQGTSPLLDLGDGRLVKSGPRVSIEEAKTMQFIRAHTTIPVPEVLMVFKWAGHMHLVMPIIDGETLEYMAFHDIKREELLSLVQQWHGFAAEIKALGSTFMRPTFGSWPGVPYRNSYFMASPPSCEFSSMAEFHSYWIDRLHTVPRLLYGGEVDGRAEVALCALRDTGESMEPVLTHGDFAARIVLVKDGRIIAVLDWDTFGWYPEFWERLSVYRVMTEELCNIVMEIFGECTIIELVYALTLYELFDRPD